MINSEDLTFANVLKAAWAYVLARHSATNDIVFGSLVHGRGQAGSQDVFGACVNIIPYRIIFGQNWTARYLLAAVAAQQLAHTPFESMGSQSIIRNCTNWAKWLFSSFVIIHQNFEQRSLRGRAVDFDSADMSPDDVDDVEVYVISTPGEDGMEILLSFNNQVVSQALAETMALDLSETITEFYTKMDAKLMSPNEIHGMSALLPRPEGRRSSSVSPTSEQLTASGKLLGRFASCSQRHVVRYLLFHERSPPRQLHKVPVRPRRWCEHCGSAGRSYAETRLSCRNWRGGWASFLVPIAASLEPAAAAAAAESVRIIGQTN